LNDDLNARLERAFRGGAEARDGVKLLKQQARMDPVGTAALLVKEIPEQRKRIQEEIASSFGVDLSDTEGLKGRYSGFSAEMVTVLQAFNLYRGLGEFQRRIEAMVADTSLSEETRTTKICELGTEVLGMLETNLLHTLHEIRKVAASHSDHRGHRYAQETEASRLAGHLATRISVVRNSRLREALDEIREHNKPPKRERFEALLRELFAHAPAIWDDHHNDDLSLRVTRNTVVRRIEKPGSSTPPETELTTFAVREAALKKARDAGLTPRELELFTFFVENPKARNTEAARALGIAEGTVRSLKSRIKKALAA
jgi:DNA-binding CsgD family transcriptional regulator